MRTVPVQIECRNCGHYYRTTVRGGNTRCRECGTSRYVRQEQEWEGPVTPALSRAASRAEELADRLPVWMECGCGHEWQSRAKDRTSIHCPDCGISIRVPQRTHHNTGPRPEGEAYAPAPAPAWRSSPRLEEPHDDWEEEAPRPTLAAWWRSGGREEVHSLFGRPLPGARPAPAPVRPPQPRPAPAPAPVVRRASPAPAPVDPATLDRRDEERRDSVCQIVRSLPGTDLMVWYNRPLGFCEALDTREPKERQECPGVATHAVRFTQGVTVTHAYSCPAHAQPLARLADRSTYITATIHPLRSSGRR